MKNALIASAVYEGGFDRNRHYLLSIFPTHVEYLSFFDQYPHWKYIPRFNWNFETLKKEDFDKAKSVKASEMNAAFNTAATLCAVSVPIEFGLLNEYAQNKRVREQACGGGGGIGGGGGGGSGGGGGGGGLAQVPLQVSTARTGAFSALEVRPTFCFFYCRHRNGFHFHFLTSLMN